MAKIQELLDNLLHKKLGRDVRQSIHDSIEQCYKDATGHPESVAGVIEENKNMQKQLDSNINTINGRIDTILTGTVNTTKLVTVHSATIRNNSASDLTFKISSKDNETLKSIKDKSPTVINANVIAKALDGVAINGASIPSSYNVESTKDEYSITVYSGSSSVVGQYVFMAVVTIAYKDTATDISSAELKDIRTGANGTTYPTAGDAVREQINDLKKELDDSNLDENVSQIQQNMKDISQLKESLIYYDDDLKEYEEIEATKVSENGKVYNLKDKNETNVNIGCFIKQNIPNGITRVKVSGKSSNATYFFDLGAFYTADGTLISRFGNDNNTEYVDLEVFVPSNASYMIVNQANTKAENYKKIKAYVIESIYDNYIEQTDARIKKIESQMDNDSLLEDVAFALFHTWGLIGDSLSVGHTVNSDKTTTQGRNIYYSWGQYLARRLGNVCLNFGKSGISSYGWMTDALCYQRLIDQNNLCQAYIIALGANDSKFETGTIEDVNFEDMTQNAETEYGYYAKVINAVRKVSEKAPIFLCTIPYPRNQDPHIQAINEMIRTFVNGNYWDNVFLVDRDAEYNDYYKTGKIKDEIRNTGWHLTSLGYLYESYVFQKALSKVVAENASRFQDVFLLPYGNNTILD